MIKISALSVTPLMAAMLIAASAAAASPETDSLIRSDGSSTVYPITEAVAEEFGTANRQAKITVGISGTGGGFKKFCSGESDLSNASRPIKESEIEVCKQHGISFIELPVAYDALTVVINSKNTWVDHLTTAELKRIWEPAAQGKITKWNQIRSNWPDQPLHLFGPGVDSGTFDYFTQAIVGTERASRGDYTSSEDDNVVVQGVSNDLNGLGYFGLAYFQENRERVKAVPIDDQNDTNGKGPIMPSVESVLNESYQPLARPLFIYVTKDAFEKRPLVQKFITFYLESSPRLVEEVGYIKLPGELQSLALARLQKSITGSIFAGGAKGPNLAELLKQSNSKGGSSTH